MRATSSPTIVRKLFIVASGNTAAYESLRKTVGSEPDVAIIYDRRSHSAREPMHERRRETALDQEIQANGWAVARNPDAEPIRELEIAASRYNQLRSIWRMPGEPAP